ncbi:MAG: hypothetical protein Kow0037_24180 [Calditrichia bacterium]
MISHKTKRKKDLAQLLNFLACRDGTGYILKKRLKNNMLSIPYKSFLLLFFLIVSVAFSAEAGESQWLLQMFSSETSDNLIPEINDGYGVVFRDLNRDGYPDLYFVRFRELNRLFINPGKPGRFQDATISSGLGGNLTSFGQENLELGAAAIDMNNDGLIDVAIAGWGESTRFFLQKNNLNFAPLENLPEKLFHPDANGTAWADVNLDGNLDVFITDEHNANRLLLGDGLGNFTDGGDRLEENPALVSQSAAFADLDGDNDPDLYVCNWFAPDILYENRNGRFVKRTLPLFHLTHPVNSNGVSFGDLDNDGDLDLLVTDRDRLSRIYLNTTVPGDTVFSFQEFNRTLGFEINFPAYGSVFADFNNDGWQDIWVNCVGPNHLFLNRQGKSLELAYRENIKFWHPKKNYSTGAAVADLDNDGDPDLVVANKDTACRVYKNPLNNNNYLKFYLTGVADNQDAIGAKVWLFRKVKNDRSELVGYREVVSQSGYLSQSSPVLHFGAASGDTFLARIQFPSGKTLELYPVFAGQEYRVSEKSGIVRLAEKLNREVRRKIHHPHFVRNLLGLLLLVISVLFYSFWAGNRYRWNVAKTGIYYLGALTLSGIVLQLFSEKPLYWRVFIAWLLLLAVFLGLTFFMEQIRRLTLKRNRERQLLLSFSQQLIYLRENEQLFKEVTQKISQTMHPEFTGIALIRKEGVEWKGFIGVCPAELRHQIENILQQSERTLREPELPEEVIALPIGSDSPPKGYLVIAQPQNGRRFTTDDRNVFRALTAQTAIAMENNYFIEETRRLTQKLTEAEIREKYTAELEEAHARLQKLYRDLKDTQAQLIQSEKMAGLGQLVAGIAHELNNPIGYIYANLKELEKYLSDVETLLLAVEEVLAERRPLSYLKETAQKIELDFIRRDIPQLIRESIEGGKRIKDVVTNLRNFSRLDEGEKKAVDLNEGLQSTLRLLRHQTRDRIKIHSDLKELPLYTCNPGQINQVFMNILVNAVQAIEGEGNISIETGFDGQTISIKICDDGRGIPPEEMDRIFDPFYTTKPVGQGTGLGLSISYKIIREHSGTIEVESRPGQGSCFTIRLPFSEKGDPS